MLVKVEMALCRIAVHTLISNCCSLRRILVLTEQALRHRDEMYFAIREVYSQKQYRSYVGVPDSQLRQRSGGFN